MSGAMRRADVAIIGAGVIGACLAWRLAETGASVVVIDAGKAEDQASTGSLAWLNASSTADEGYAAVRAASVRLWRTIAEDSGCPVTFNGCLMWGDDPAACDEQAERMMQIGWRSHVMSRDEIEVAIDGMAAPEAALWSPDEGYADPARITGWMQARAAAAGARIEIREVGSLDQVPADRIVVCAGNGAPGLLPGLPLRRSPGIVMRTAPLPVVVPHVMASPTLDFWQGPDGVIVMSSSLSKTPERADQMMAADAVAELTRLFPGLDAQVASTIRRDRPIPADGYPLVGRWGDVWVAATHSGMTLAPVIADYLTDSLLDRPARFDLSRYRPDRAMEKEHERSAL